MRGRARVAPWVTPVLVAGLTHVGLALVPLPARERAAAPMVVRLQAGAARPGEHGRVAAQAAPGAAQSAALGVPEPGVAAPGQAGAPPGPMLADRARPRAPRPGAGQRRAGVDHDAAERVGPSDDGDGPGPLDSVSHGGSAPALAALDALPGHAPLPGPAADADVDAYARTVRGLVEAQKRYPAGAERRRQHGLVLLGVRIRPDGRLAAPARVVRSSGAAALDREAVRMVDAAAPFPPSKAGRIVDIELPVRFSLPEP